MEHCRHFRLDEDDDFGEDLLTATIVCDCGWFGGPVLREGAWKTRLIKLFRAHVDEIRQALSQ